MPVLMAAREAIVEVCVGTTIAEADPADATTAIAILVVRLLSMIQKLIPFLEATALRPCEYAVADSNRWERFTG